MNKARPHGGLSPGAAHAIALAKIHTEGRMRRIIGAGVSLTALAICSAGAAEAQLACEALKGLQLPDVKITDAVSSNGAPATAARPTPAGGAAAATGPGAGGAAASRAPQVPM